MAETTSPETKQKNQQPLIVFLILVVILAFLGLAAFAGFYLRQTKGGATTPTPTPTLAPTPTSESTPTPEEKVSPTPTLKPTATPTPSLTPTPTPTSTPTPAPKADLYISEYSFNHPPKKGEPFTVRIGIYNQGNAAAGPFWWEWWATWAVRACRERIDSLAAHGGRIVFCTYTYGGWANYQTKAVADADNEVEESDEGNNTYTQNVVPIH